MAESIFPVVRMLFVCQLAKQEQATGYWNLFHPLTTVRLPDGAKFPFLVEELSVYAQVAGGIGVFNLKLEACQIMDDGTRRFMGHAGVKQVTLSANERLLATDFSYLLKNLPLRSPGIYEFRLTHDGQELPGAKAELTVLVSGAVS